MFSPLVAASREATAHLASISDYHSILTGNDNQKFDSIEINRVNVGGRLPRFTYQKTRRYALGLFGVNTGGNKGGELVARPIARPPTNEAFVGTGAVEHDWTRV